MIIMKQSFYKSSVFKMFSVHTTTQRRSFQISRVWRVFSESSVEIKLRFQVPLVKCGQALSPDVQSQSNLALKLLWLAMATLFRVPFGSPHVWSLIASQRWRSHSLAVITYCPADTGQDGARSQKVDWGLGFSRIIGSKVQWLTCQNKTKSQYWCDVHVPIEVNITSII